ncbi:MAG TPA: hypothetical protein VFQ44_02320 [Streptosporangiaceae bacterium]|nr:hypothetical protein [Streptosporangiaceae bacterium]
MKADRLAIGRRDYIAVTLVVNAAHDTATAAARKRLDAAEYDGDGERVARIPDSAREAYNTTCAIEAAKLRAARATAEAEIDAAIAEARENGTYHWDIASPDAVLEPRLPTWAEMTDADKAAALAHLDKAEWEGTETAVRYYPPAYAGNPVLARMDRDEASRHAASMSADIKALDPGEYARLLDIAFARKAA